MKALPPCIFPSDTEQDVVTVPGVEPCTAYRLRVEPGVAGYLRIEQLAYNEAMGWYVQKSFCLPGDVVHQLMPHLKQASALLPLPGRRAGSIASSHNPSINPSMQLHVTFEDAITVTGEMTQKLSHRQHQTQITDDAVEPAAVLRFPLPSSSTSSLSAATKRKTS